MSGWEKCDSKNYYKWLQTCRNVILYYGLMWLFS